MPIQEMPGVISGATYRNSDTATADTARRFETTKTMLSGGIIVVEDYPQYFGDSSTQDVPVGPGETFAGFQFNAIDISTLYFKNKDSGNNGTVRVLAVEA